MSEDGENATDHEDDPLVYETVGDWINEKVDVKSERNRTVEIIKWDFSKTQVAIAQKSANNGSYFCFSSSV